MTPSGHRRALLTVVRNERDILEELKLLRRCEAKNSISSSLNRLILLEFTTSGVNRQCLQIETTQECQHRTHQSHHSKPKELKSSNQNQREHHL